MTGSRDEPLLTNGRITLRSVRPDDAAGLRELAADPLSLTSIEGSPGPQRLVRLAVDAVDANGETRLAGHVTLQFFGPIAAITYDISPGLRNRRIASEAVTLAVDWAFKGGGAETVTWTSQVGNLAAWRVAWRNGFTFEASTRRSILHATGVVDAWHASLLRSDTREPKTSWFEPVRLGHVGVVLRDLDDADEQRYLETLEDPESQLWLASVPLPRTPAAFRSMMRGRRLNGTLGRSLGWTVAHPETDTYLASVSLFEMDGLDYKSGEVGYRTHPDARGRGVLTSALRALIAHAFMPIEEGGIGLERVQLLAGDGNHASHGVARSCGFTEVGRDRRCYDLPDGRVVDLIRFDLLRSEFQPGSSRP